MNNSRDTFAPDLTVPQFLSLVVALLVATVSLAGIFWQENLYRNEALRQAFVSNDVVNLVIGLPILLGSLVLARRGKLIGLLCWPGALLYMAYNYIAYATAMPGKLQYMLYLAVVILSVIAIYLLLTMLDVAAIQQRLAGAVPERLAGGVLTGLGLLFFLWRVVHLVNVVTGKETLSKPEIGVLTADLLTIPAWVAGGVLLWRKQALGYASGAGLLFQASMLFVGLLMFFILQPLVAGLPFPAADFGVILVMGLVCFIPFALYVRGVLKRS